MRILSGVPQNHLFELVVIDLRTENGAADEGLNM